MSRWCHRGNEDPACGNEPAATYLEGIVTGLVRDVLAGQVGFVPKCPVTTAIGRLEFLRIIRMWPHIIPLELQKTCATCVRSGIAIGLMAFFLVADVEHLLAESLYESVVEEIRAEALRGNNDAIGRPLPLAAHWNTGVLSTGYTPDYQVELIKKGHHILPWFEFSSPLSKPVEMAYYARAMRFFAENGLPISFVSTQWESLLTDEPWFKKKQPDDNPNVINISGEIENKVSPFGPLLAWKQAGMMWTSRRYFEQIQEFYPNPPKVLFISNNEHKKLRWHEATESKRFVSEYGSSQNPEQARKIVGNAWIERYRALQEGMRQGLSRISWKKNSIYVGYNAFGGSALGRWNGWIRYSLYTKGRMEPWPLAWDGASVPFYVHNWNPGTDYNLMSPQIQAMNWIFMLEEAYQMNPDFWFEISVWDGHASSMDNDKRRYYIQQGQKYGPGRYEGMVQFGMWLLRPRVVREFRGWKDTVAKSGEYFDVVLNSVDRIYQNPVLRKFWRSGQLVANSRQKHPFQYAIPEEYQARERWFLLDTDRNPERPWQLNTRLNLFSIALSLGEGEKKEWIIYAFSPLPQSGGATIHIPGFGSISLTKIPQWGFFHVVGKTGKVTLIQSG